MSYYKRNNGRNLKRRVLALKEKGKALCQQQKISLGNDSEQKLVAVNHLKNALSSWEDLAETSSSSNEEEAEIITPEEK